MIERKYVPFDVKATGDDGTFEGYASVFGTIDQGGDIVDPGAFAGTLEQFLAKGIIALYHDWTKPIGRPIKAYTDQKGLYLHGKLVDTDDARDARTLMREKVIQGLSIGYKTLIRQYIEKAEDVEEYWRSIGYNPTEDDLQAKSSPYGVRVLMKIKLYETSPVPFPMNDQCDITAAKGEAPERRTFDQHSDQVLSTVEEFIERAHGLAAVRAEKGRSLTEERRVQLKRLRDRIEELLTAPAPFEEAESLYEKFRLLETEARIVGVPLGV
jgi:Escherichia/Staphylococcus phage prohead protease